MQGGASQTSMASPRAGAKAIVFPPPVAPKATYANSCMPCLQLDDVEGDEALYSHLLPKVMAPYDTRPGDTPRKVLIQRSAEGASSTPRHAAWRIHAMRPGHVCLGSQGAGTVRVLQ